MPAVTKKPFDIATDNAPGAYFPSPANDGMEIYYRTWLPPSGVTPIALVLAIHGLGEHINRYDHVYSAFAAQGIAVKGLDYRGHGRTWKKNAKSQPAYLKSFEIVWDDIIAMAEIKVDSLPDNLPLFVMGHSLGGLIALTLVHHCAARLPNLRGVISQAPALKPAKAVFPPIKFAAKLLGPSVLPTLSQPNGLCAKELCTSQEVVDTYLADPLVHDIITLRLARDIFIFGDGLLEKASTFTVPVIMYFGSEDKMTNFPAGKTFFDSCGSSDKTFKAFPGVEHEIHNEPTIKDSIISDYVQWISTRATPTSPTSPVSETTTAATAVEAPKAAPVEEGEGGVGEVAKYVPEEEGEGGVGEVAKYTPEQPKAAPVEEGEGGVGEVAKYVPEEPKKEEVPEPIASVETEAQKTCEQVV
ncbi:hypothetical protein HDU96_005743 [Phlyctochytrium bullatum]|nr:hypothetical protein HDU96_005743 [Phlyctochytrium bullatum]